MKIEYIPVTERDRELLWNLNQKYLYEMTNYYDDPMDEKGNLHYGYFDQYFTDPKRSALLLYADHALAGFAMLHPYSGIGATPDYVLAEFTVFPAFRKRHIATAAAELLFTRYRGQWEVKYNEKNLAAKRLWHKVTAPYSPVPVHLNDTETVLTFSTDTKR